MKKARFVLFKHKKDAQRQEDASLDAAGRFKKMFELISMALLLSPDKPLKENKDPRFIELKRVKP